jgi:hypothetical protein
VVSFDRAVNKKDQETMTVSDVDSSDEDDEGNPTKKKVIICHSFCLAVVEPTKQTAARSIEAFLADQSDSE